jgi:hypothetical protein
MKATIDLDEDLYRQLKATAALQGSKVKDLVAQGIRMVLREGDHRNKARRIKLPIVKSRKPGTLKLTDDMISRHEVELDAGRDA